MIEIEPLNLTDVLYVCKNMRRQDWLEVLNCLPKAITKADTVAMICMQASKFGYVAKIDGVPAGVIQIGEVLDGTYRFGLFGTNRLPEVALALCVEIMRTLPKMIDDGMKHGEALADALHPEAHKLLTFLGFKKRAMLEGYGSHGADLVLFTISRREADVLYGRWGRIVDAYSGANLGAGDGRNRGAAGIS